MFSVFKNIIHGNILEQSYNNKLLLAIKHIVVPWKKIINNNNNKKGIFKDHIAVFLETVTS